MHDHCRDTMRVHCGDLFAGGEAQCTKEEPATRVQHQLYA
jgi:hypothetical protein